MRQKLSKYAGYKTTTFGGALGETFFFPDPVSRFSFASRGRPRSRIGSSSSSQSCLRVTHSCVLGAQAERKKSNFHQV
jgi:hypothetical protein